MSVLENALREVESHIIEGITEFGDVMEKEAVAEILIRSSDLVNTDTLALALATRIEKLSQRAVELGLTDSLDDARNIVGQGVVDRVHAMLVELLDALDAAGLGVTEEDEADELEDEDDLEDDDQDDELVPLVAYEEGEAGPGVAHSCPFCKGNP